MASYLVPCTRCGVPLRHYPDGTGVRPTVAYCGPCEAVLKAEAAVPTVPKRKKGWPLRRG